MLLNKGVMANLICHQRLYSHFQLHGDKSPNRATGQARLLSGRPAMTKHEFLVMFRLVSNTRAVRKDDSLVCKKMRDDLKERLFLSEKF